jgi:hypothetical protein
MQVWSAMQILSALPTILHLVGNAKMVCIAICKKYVFDTAIQDSMIGDKTHHFHISHNDNQF